MTTAIEQAAEALKLVRRTTQMHIEVVEVVDAALARLTAERAAVPPDRERDAMAKRLDGVAFILELDGIVNAPKTIREAAALLRSPADGRREGAEAMREACIALIISWMDADRYGDIIAVIRALDIPSPPAEEKP